VTTCPQCESQGTACYFCLKARAGAWERWDWTIHPDGLTRQEQLIIGVGIPRESGTGGWHPATGLTTAWPTKQELIVRGVRWLLDIGDERLELNT
jgi:hypothetical protein